MIGQKSTYGGTASVLLNLLPRLGVSVTQVDQTDPEAFEKALTPRTRLILVESPSNPLLQVSVREGEGIVSFAAPPLVRDGPLGEQFVGEIVAAFGINRNRVLAHQWVDNGPG